jgi:hypothetical protein
VPNHELGTAAAAAPTTFEGFTGTGGGDGMRTREEVTKSSKSSKDMAFDDLPEFSACAENGNINQSTG